VQISKRTHVTTDGGNSHELIDLPGDHDGASKPTFPESVAKSQGRTLDYPPQSSFIDLEMDRKDSEYTVWDGRPFK
jgi:hypothetical protein